MDELIRRSDAIDVIKKNHYRLEGHGLTEELLIEQMCSIPSADRPQGEWVYTDNPLRLDDEWACNRCGNISFVRTNFCDRCGAHMKGADNE